MSAAVSADQDHPRGGTALPPCGSRARAKARTAVARIRVRVVQRTRKRAKVKEYSPVAKKIRLVYTAAALVPLTVLAAACGSSTPTKSSTGTSAPAASNSGKQISETGSTLLFPLFGAWQNAYSSTNSNVTITSGSTGSGTGIADAANGLVNIGASDAYLSSSNMTQYPNLINIPLTVAAVMVNYNVPGVTKPINLNGTVVAKIYSGKITKWNDPAIAAINKGVTLPSTPIVTLHRGDSSGTTFVFTSYLNAQDPADWPSSAVGTTVTWPTVSGQLAETGSGGMVSGCGSTKGCIAYIGISYQSAAGYPILNYEYAVVDKHQSSVAESTAVKAFLGWIIANGDTSKYLGPVGFEPLPSGTASVSTSLISSITG